MKTNNQTKRPEYLAMLAVLLLAGCVAPVAMPTAAPTAAPGPGPTAPELAPAGEPAVAVPLTQLSLVPMDDAELTTKSRSCARQRNWTSTS
jgi:hypothetical protein